MKATKLRKQQQIVRKIFFIDSLKEHMLVRIIVIIKMKACKYAINSIAGGSQELWSGASCVRPGKSAVRNWQA